MGRRGYSARSPRRACRRSSTPRRWAPTRPARRIARSTSTGRWTASRRASTAEVERLLDRFEAKHPEVRVVRLRPGLIFKREAASGIRRLFAGPFLPSPLLRPAFQRFVPDLPGLRFQAVYSLDAGDAYRLAIVRDVRGAFNIAVEPVLDAARLAEVLDARPARTARAPRRPPRARRPGHAAARAADRRPAADPGAPDRRRPPLARWCQARAWHRSAAFRPHPPRPFRPSVTVT